jgi:hypothetical protein
MSWREIRVAMEAQVETTEQRITLSAYAYYANPTTGLSFPSEATLRMTTRLGRNRLIAARAWLVARGHLLPQGRLRGTFNGVQVYKVGHPEVGTPVTVDKSERPSQQRDGQAGMAVPNSLNGRPESQGMGVPAPGQGTGDLNLLPEGTRTCGRGNTPTLPAQWWRSNPGIDKAAHLLGIKPTHADDYRSLKQRCFARLDELRAVGQGNR